MTGEGDGEGSGPAIPAGIRALLLDLDGTLYREESYPLYFRSMDLVTGRRVQEAYGAATEADAFSALEADRKARGMRSKSEILERVHGIPLSAMNRFREANTFPEEHLQRDPRLVGTLADLASSCRLGLGTNNAPGLARRILRCLGVPESLFAFIQTSEDCGTAKPERAFFLEAVRRLDVPAHAILSVGDTPASDLHPAAEMGMSVLLVSRMEDIYRLPDLLAPPASGAGRASEPRVP